MARQENETRALPSFLDRLIDSEPGVSRDLIPSREVSLRRFRDSVLRDLENLLNARNPFALLDDEFVHVRRSVIAYGLVDFSNLNIANPNDRIRLEAALEQSIRDFEPRLGDLRVSLFPAQRTDRSLRFRVDARIRVEPAPEPVSFDMVLELDKQECHVSASP